MSKPITIHKHTPKRYKRSVWVVSNIMSIDGATMYSTNCTAPMLVLSAPMLVQDIKTGLENPLETREFFKDIQKFEDMYVGMDFGYQPKSSLLTKLKNKLRRK